MKENNKNHHKDAAKEAQDPKKGEDPSSAKAPTSDEVVMIPKVELDALRAISAEKDAFQDKYLRAHAEFENARRRLEKEKSEFVKFANEGFVIDFLPILDNLEVAERFIKEAKDFKAVRDGVDMIHGQIQRFVKDIGVERIRSQGEMFDPHIHEPMETEESPDKKDGFILNELKPGYKFNGKLLRPAMVKIVKQKSAVKDAGAPEEKIEESDTK